ncbi:hypothetical protein K466DRAFT_237136 [Polyporus arcularius HHB13444]|uniref:DUF7918 domain-containing protein n=1 Tax=Polyporus arcularius HHB13444 TaxID=1314778 RepID=A0A5C3PRX4_9APHY|nr:hypothetical protein K466DRAFT_237136 [Polyporus arcularius HHB13444]
MRRKGYEVWIASEGDALQEYQVKLENGGRRVACFVPIETDKCFSIHCSDLVEQSFFSMEVTLDGRFVCRTLCAPGSTSKRDGLRTSETTLRQYRFAEVPTTDDNGSSADTADLGTIVVALERRYPDSRDIPFQAWTLPDVGAISERMKTIGAQQVSLSQEVSIGRPGAMQEALPLHPAEGCFNTFVFRYRPLAVLQAQGIAPLSVRTDLRDEGPRYVIDIDPPHVQPRLPVPARGSSLIPGEASVLNHPSRPGSVSEGRPDKGKRRAEALGDETDAEEQQVEVELRSPKRAKLAKTLSSEITVSEIGGSNDESELNTLKAGVESLKAQLKRMESQIHSIEKGRRSSRSRWTNAGCPSAASCAKPEPPTVGAQREMITQGVIDLTLAD